MNLLTLVHRFPLFKEGFHSLLSVFSGYVRFVIFLLHIIAFLHGELYALVDGQLGAAQRHRGVARDLTRQRQCTLKRRLVALVLRHHMVHQT